MLWCGDTKMCKDMGVRSYCGIACSCDGGILDQEVLNGTADARSLISDFVSLLFSPHLCPRAQVRSLSVALGRVG